MKTNKEKELQIYLGQIEQKELISIKDWRELIDKIADALQRKQSQIDEVKESRDSWKRECLKLRENQKHKDL